MDRKEAWQCFENTGSVEAYLAYRALEQKEAEYDLQSQRNSTEDQSNHS